MRELIIQLRQKGKLLRAISKLVNKSHSMVQYIVNRHRELQTCENRPRLGRRKKLNAIHKRALCKVINESPRTNAPTLTKMIEDDYDIHVVPETVRNALREQCLHGRVPRKKPYISKEKKALRYEFAKRHLNKPISF